MAMIPPTHKAGPLGRARVSSVLRKRPNGDPRERRNFNLLATNRRTARGVDALVLDYTGIPLVEETQLRLVVDKVNEIIAGLKERGLMEQMR